MPPISLTELIITCESCGNVKRFSINSQDDWKTIFHNFKCENNCGRNLYSFITVGTINRIAAPAQANYALAVAH